MTIQRMQDKLTAGGENGNAVTRQIYFPKEVYLFAVNLKLADERPAGKSRTGQPTLPDIYYQLFQEGLDILLMSEEKPVFVEYGRPEGNRSSRVKFPFEVYETLTELKQEADAGAYEVQPYKEISIIALVVNLIQLAIKKRQEAKPADC